MAQTKIEQGLLKFTEATDYLKIPTGTTAQRPSSPEAGYIRFNTTISKFEIYNGTDWTEPGITPPTITSLDYPATKTALDPAGGETLLINGTNFQAGITVDFGGTAATSITINSLTQLSVVVPAKAAGNVTLTITNTDAGSVQTTVVYNALPTWTTAAGSLGSVNEGDSISFTVAASEADSGAITYSVTSGSLPTGTSLNSSTGAITGTAGAVSANTTYNFTITATDDENQTASRAFSITVINILPSEHFGVVLYEGDGTSGHSINGGKFGAAFYGNGSNSRIDSTSIGAWPSGNAARSISFWMYSDSYADGGIVAYGTAASNQGFAFYIASSQLIMTFYGVNASINYALSADQWYHVVATHDGTTFKAYINGSQEYSDTRTLNTGTTAFRIGGVPWNNAGEFFNGKIDQVRVFQKALSSSEVTTLYSETASTVESLDPLSEDTTGTLQVLGDSSCLATYQFENNEDDLSGNYNGVGTKIQYRAGRYGQATSFDGSSSYITIPSSTNPLGFINNNFSYSLWINVTAGGEDDIIGNWNTGLSSDNHFLMIFNGKLRMHLKGAGVGDSTASISTNQWYHIVCTTDWTNGQFKYYINNSLDSTKTISTTPHSVSATNNLYIGTRSGGSPNFGGRIDQVRIFNKVLSSSEVTTLYNENSLIASYRFEGNAEDDTKNYDGTATNVTYEYGLSFTPDFVWLKVRSAAGYNHNVFDTTRGATKRLMTNLTNAEDTNGALSSFDTGGFTLAAGGDANPSGQDLVAWCLKANGGTTSSNTDGTITSTVQVNQSLGFSIATYTGTGATASVGHGLGQKPDFVIIKHTNDASAWVVFSDATGTFSYSYLNLTSTFTAYPAMSWDSSVLNLNSGGDQNGLNDTHIAYFFASKAGFSKIGSYTGNGSTNGPIIQTGFEPAFLMVKRTDSADGWIILDNKRDLTNPRDNSLKADESSVEENNSVNRKTDFLSNGFQLKHSHQGMNASGGTYFYIAFAADPDTVVPTKAKSFSAIAYTGNGTSLDLYTGFKPGLIWTKPRSYIDNHQLWDIVRGAGWTVYGNSTNAENPTIRLDGVSSFNDDGFSIGNWNNINVNGSTYVAWVWKADDDEPTINTDGSVNSIVSTNANAGFSIVKYTGNGTSGATIGHGLSAAPELIITKNLSAIANWVVHTTAVDGSMDFLYLNTNDAKSDSSLSVPTSTVFSRGNASLDNTSGNNYIAYCFHSVSEFSKIGTYTGTGSSVDNNITTLGFRPDFVMIKRTDSAGDWVIGDSVREANGQITLLANSNGTESNQAGDDIALLLDNGFRVRTNLRVNASGGTFIYMAFKIN